MLNDIIWIRKKFLWSSKVDFIYLFLYLCKDWKNYRGFRWKVYY